MTRFLSIAIYIIVGVVFSTALFANFATNRRSLQQDHGYIERLKLLQISYAKQSIVASDLSQERYSGGRLGNFRHLFKVSVVAWFHPSVY